MDHVEVGGIDFSVWKIFLKALYRPLTTESKYYSDINVSFRNCPKELMVNEVKKVGVIIDRGQEMQFRGGDQLIVYVSMGGFEK